MGVLGDGTALPMGAAMFFCALGALLAASLRPQLIFRTAEA
jgi:hypothetical protein